MAEDNTLDVRGLDPIIEKMRYFPQKFKQMQKLGMHASLMTLWEHVPPYPQRSDADWRTGTLGRSLGSSQSGGKQGKPQIFKIQKLGSSRAEGRFGTNIKYAPYVIGDRQRKMKVPWWKLTDVLKAATPKIIRIWEGVMEEMAKWLERPSSGAR